MQSRVADMQHFVFVFRHRWVPEIRRRYVRVFRRCSCNRIDGQTKTTDKGRQNEGQGDRETDRHSEVRSTPDGPRQQYQTFERKKQENSFQHPRTLHISNLFNLTRKDFKKHNKQHIDYINTNYFNARPQRKKILTFYWITIIKSLPKSNKGGTAPWSRNWKPQCPRPRVPHLY